MDFLRIRTHARTQRYKPRELIDKDRLHIFLIFVPPCSRNPIYSSELNHSATVSVTIQQGSVSRFKWITLPHWDMGFRESPYLYEEYTTKEKHLFGGHWLWSNLESVGLRQVKTPKTRTPKKNIRGDPGSGTQLRQMEENGGQRSRLAPQQPLSGVKGERRRRPIDNWLMRDMWENNYPTETVW